MTPFEKWLCSPYDTRAFQGGYSDRRGLIWVSVLERRQEVGRGTGATFEEAAADAMNDIMRRQAAEAIELDRLDAIDEAERAERAEKAAEGRRLA